MTFAPFAPIPIYFIYAFSRYRNKAFVPEDSWERTENLNKEENIETYTYHGERATSFRRNGSSRRKRVENTAA